MASMIVLFECIVELNLSFLPFLVIYTTCNCLCLIMDTMFWCSVLVSNITLTLLLKVMTKLLQEIKGNHE
jgi:hypothetical protein